MIQMEKLKKDCNDAINEKERSTRCLLEEKEIILKNVREKYERIKAENEELKVNGARLIRRVSEQETQIEDLQVQLEVYIRESKRDLSLMENQYDAMDSELKQLTGRRTELTQQERRCRKTVAELEEKNKELLEKYMKARRKKRKYKTKLMETERKLKGLELQLVLNTNPSKENTKPQQIVSY
eukprot:TRINITY_DN6978_c0_g1_i2.p1 TRINITY_DN6978_c0_g1~~TRINITY_DN6978_c0_g1_i2.p1  ORF type:complete len:183 (+),score=66.55 TRINITY_DN6978_c0_g1_i2:101-649(+)